jgi:MFS family permease
VTLTSYGASVRIIVDTILRREGQEAMTKATITRLWVVGLIVLVVGLLVGGVSVGLMLAFGGNFVPAASGSGSDFVPAFNGFFWTTVGFTVLGFTVAAVGGIIQLAAWIGALVNTYQIEDKAWFIALVIGGVLGFVSGLIGFAAMVAYIIAGPDGMRAQVLPVPQQVPRMPMYAPAPMPYPAAPAPQSTAPTTPPVAELAHEQPPLVHAN